MQPRWHTFSPGHPQEEAARARLLSAIDAWWQSFLERHEDISALFSRRQHWDLPGWMQETLQEVSPHLMWEFGPGLEVGHRLVITPEHRHRLRPLVDEILKQAPAIAGWSFFGHRLPETHDRALASVEARTGVPLQATGVRCERGRHNRIDVTVEFPVAAFRKDKDLAFSQAFVFLETTLGESVLNTWIGAIDAKAKRWGSHRLEQIGPEVARLIREVSESLPNTPLHAASNDALWSLFKIEPEPADDYPAQTDMFVGKAMNVELWQNAHSAVPFRSARYSRCGEVFCYLKIDGSEGLTGEAFQDKGDIEDALDERLRLENLGCFVGGGTGLRYSYVDLALVDVTRAVPSIRAVLQGGGLTRRSWLEFYDTEWQDEWIGIWDDSPPPPKEPSDD